MVMFKNTKKITAIYAIVIFFICFDRLLKVLAVKGYEFGIIKGVLDFNFKANSYMAFSLPFSGVLLNIFIFLIILSLIYFFARELKNGNGKSAISIFSVIAGALSNLFDRMKYGFVIDYFDLKYFTVFNIADAMIAIGALAVVVACKKNCNCKIV